MEDSAITTLSDLIIEAVKGCADVGLLDIIYKLLTH